MPSALQTVQSSGDRYFEIVNATGSIQASFQKLDSSTTHALTVEIYKNGKLITQGSASASYGTVTLSADATTGVAKPAQTSGGTSATTTPGTVKSGNATARCHHCQDHGCGDTNDHENILTGYPIPFFKPVPIGI